MERLLAQDKTFLVEFRLCGETKRGYVRNKIRCPSSTSLWNLDPLGLRNRNESTPGLFEVEFQNGTEETDDKLEEAGSAHGSSAAKLTTLVRRIDIKFPPPERMED